MKAYVRNPLIYTWLFLSAATVFSWWLGSENDAKVHQANGLVTVAILLIAVIKSRFVIRNYMEVRVAPSWLQLTCDTWLVVNFGMVSSYYWFRL